MSGQLFGKVMDVMDVSSGCDAVSNSRMRVVSIVPPPFDFGKKEAARGRKGLCGNGLGSVQMFRLGRMVFEGGRESLHEGHQGHERTKGGVDALEVIAG
jgi:hypothetical protein